MEQPLQDSEAKYRQLFEESRDAICITTRDGRLVEINQAGLDLFGYARQEILGQNLIDTYATPEDRQILLQILDRTGSVKDYEVKLRRRDGTLMDCLLSASARRAPDGTILGYQSIIRDVTESSDKTQEAFVESWPLPIVVIDRNDHVVLWNPAAEHTFGWNKKEILGHVPPLVAAEHLDEFRSLRNKAFQGKRMHNVEVTATRKDGSRVDLVLSISPLRGASGAVSHAMAIMTDVTDKKRKDKALRASQTRLELLHTIAAGINVGASAEDILQHTLSQISQVFSDTCVAYATGDGQGVFRVTHSSRSQVLGVTWEPAAEALQELRNGSPLIIEEVQGLGDGLTRAVRGLPPEVTQAALVVPVRDSEGIMGLLWLESEKPRKWSSHEIETLGSIADYVSILLTGARLQESLRQSEMMAAMGALVGGVAHEVRNPLFSISATLDAFEANFQDREEYREYILALRQELDRLNHLMSELLEYGQSGGLELSEGSIADVLMQAILACTALAEKQNVKLHGDVKLKRSTVPMDSRRMFQAIQNLLDNAIRYSPPGGDVLLEGREIHQGGNTWVVISIKDCGEGFRKEDLHRVFQPFFSRRPGGTGMGLSIVQRVVQEHGGTISARNRPEGGAEMTLRIPASCANSGKRSG